MQLNGTLYLVAGDQIVYSEHFAGSRPEAYAVAIERLRHSVADRAEIWSGPVRVADIRNRDRADD